MRPPGYNVLHEQHRAALAAKKAHAQDDELRDALKAMLPFCMLCWIRRNKFTNRHRAGGCYASHDAGSYFDWNKTYIVEDPEHTCLSCLLPKGRIASQHNAKAKGQCTYSDVINPVIWAAWESEDTRERVFAHFGVSFADRDEYTLWLQERGEGRAYLNHVEVFLFLYRESQGGGP